jgi:hypothetical protein
MAEELADKVTRLLKTSSTTRQLSVFSAVADDITDLVQYRNPRAAAPKRQITNEKANIVQRSTAAAPYHRARH